ncbi:hypothetical protein HYU06_01495 [Candidatus Woesearchaeota archaeon]|nr:hypothetical protein [Candidatus Woesearchaeota archaeon]
MKSCPTCNQPLIALRKLDIYIHDPGNLCDLNDGIRIDVSDERCFDNFQKQIGKPSMELKPSKWQLIKQIFKKSE